MLEGSSHQLFNIKDLNKKKSINYNIEKISPVIEKVEEYNSQSNEEQKIFIRQSLIRCEDNINRTHLKDSVISKILYNLNDKDIIKNKTLIIRPTPLLNQFQRNSLNPKKSLKGIINSKNLFNQIKKATPIKRNSNIKAKPKSSLSSSNHKINFNKKENDKNIKAKRKTVAFLGLGIKKRSSHLLNHSPNSLENLKQFKRPLEIKKKTYKEKSNNNPNNNSILQTIESMETNKKLNNLIKSNFKHSGITIDNSRQSDEFRFSFLIKKNKMHVAKNISFKNTKLNNIKKGTFIQNFMNESNIQEKENLLKKVKIYAFIQSICSIISILLCIIDTELYNNYSYHYIMEHKIDFDKFYLIRKRKINEKENIIRSINIIFSFLCLIMTFCIFFAKYNYNKKEMKKILNRRNRNLSNHQFTYNKSIQAKTNNETDQISKIIIRSIINFIFYPPKVNYIYHTYSNNISCVYPMNAFILLLSSFKLYNIYRCIFYFIPVTATIGKTICQKYNVKLDIRFMFKTFLSKHKLSFPFVLILIFIVLITILLRSIEKFSVDLSLLETKDPKILNYNHLINTNFNAYDTIWLYLTFITRNILGDIRPRTPIGKLLLFIIYIFGSLFVCIMYFRFNYLIQFDRTDFQAYSKLQKLFLPENKENKASEVILSFILLKKYYSLHKIDEKELETNNIHNENDNNKRRRSFLNLKIDQLKEENILKYKQKKIFFLEVKFAFYLKLLTDRNTYLDSYKVSRKQPLNMSSLFQNIENKMFDNLESISSKLSGMESIETIFENLKSNDNILLRKFQKLRALDKSIISYLADVNNFLCNNYFCKIKNLKTDILLNGISLKKSKTRILHNFKSSKIIKDK